ncbi:MAG: M20 family metallo-hydrolase [Actinomycetia bacterium]|nr:M20 family metallo-hydrolase [Actinomycetes bacterium]
MEKRDPAWRVDPDRIRTDWETLATFVDPSRPGHTRRAFSPQDRAARRWVARRMEEAGLAVTVDAAGNVWGLRPGTRDGPKLVTGSHTDTVDGGGRFDGIAGVLAALEVARVLDEAGVRLRLPLAVVDFVAEEPSPFGLSCVGSRAVSGHLAVEHLSLRDDAGRTLGEAIAQLGGDPARLASARLGPDDVAAFVELHVEQGPYLERAGARVGVVTGIVGIDRYDVEILGERGHSGTLPMSDRHDAAVAAARLVLDLMAEAARHPGAVVCTAGRWQVAPGAYNVVPGEARVGVEWRALDPTVSDAMEEALALALRALEGQGYRAEARRVSREAPVPLSPAVQDILLAAARDLGHDAPRLASWAGHDTVQMAHVTERVGMLFVPSRGGLSHSPEEWSEIADVAEGARCLAQAIVRLDGSLA